MKYLSIRNYEKYQHYKDRRPPWIKLYNDILDDYDFRLLSDEAKFHLLGLTLLASRNDNKIPLNYDFISQQLGAKKPLNIKELKKFLLVSKGRNASTALADCKQSATLETEIEEETYKEEAEKRKKAPPKATYAENPTQNVTLTEKEHQTLVEKHGLSLTTAFIEKLNNHKASKGQTYKSDYHAILNWVIDAVTNSNGQPKKQGVDAEIAALLAKKGKP